MLEDALFMKIVNQMAIYTKPSLAAIYGTIDKETGELVGSGTFINLLGKPYLLTAGHVAHEKDKYIGLAHSRSDGFTPAYVTNPYNILSGYYDLCLIRIEQEQLSGTNIIPLTISNISSNSDNIDNDFLFIHGYPGERSRFLRLFNGVISNTLPYGTGVSNSQYPWFDHKYHFAIDYSSNSTINSNLEAVTLPDPHGLSGSAVWRLDNDVTNAEVSLNSAKIVGIVHTWDDKAHSLIATRIEIVREFLLQSLRNELAYFNWINRGSPFGDEWTDWLIACQKIQEIS